MRWIFAIAMLVCTALPAAADEARLDALFEALGTADEVSWEGIEDQIWDAWSQSGSPSLDFLLQRGREAIAAGEHTAAIEHLTALVETAPDFAAGWNARATAFYEAGLAGPALADIARTLALEPRHFGALTGLGLILEDSGDAERARDAYGAALAIHPFRPDLREAIDRLEAALQGTTI